MCFMRQTHIFSKIHDHLEKNIDSSVHTTAQLPKSRWSPKLNHCQSVQKISQMGNDSLWGGGYF